MLKPFRKRVAKAAGYLNRTGSLTAMALRVLACAVLAASGLVAAAAGVSRSVATVLIFGAIVLLVASFPMSVLYWKLRAQRLRRLHASTPPTPNHETGEIQPRHPTV